MNNINYNIDELLSIVELMKQSLSFYGNENNYNDNIIINDKGNQARMILNQVKDLMNIKQNFENELDDYLKNGNNDNIEKFNEFINKLI